jgi:predicted ATP-dependent serine protease
MTKYIKADCGFHYSEKGGACSKCAAHPAIAAKVSSMKRNKIKYLHEDKMKKVYYTYQGIYGTSTKVYTTDKGQLHAQQELAKAFNARKPYQVTIAIVERDGEPYYNSPTL